MAWWTVAVGNPITVAENFVASAYGIKTVFYIVVQALGVYFNLYFLLPRLLEKGRYTLYVITVLLTILAMAILIVPGYYFSAYLVGDDLKEIYGPNADFLHFFQANTLSSSAAAMTLAMSVKLTKNWLQSRRREELLQKEKLETELNFLRSQFHPHFLFNTINSIFVLIRKDQNKASDALEKFSSLLRYQLYECNENKIPLRQELVYVSNYFELQKLRADDNIRLTMNVPKGLPEDLYIAPFMLVPFVENAFKHVSRQHNSDNYITINIEVNNRQLHLQVMNSVSPYDIQSADAEYSGIGHENIRRRLELTYPGKHSLASSRNADEFLVDLNLELEVFASPVQQVAGAHDGSAQPINPVYQ